jgi:putative endonuclease
VHYVYILRSKNHGGETYIGCTHDLRIRLAQHNAGKSIHTNKFKPWDLLAYVALREKSVAEKFEKYLKTGSGHAFAARHFSIPVKFRNEESKPRRTSGSDLHSSMFT